MGPFGSNIKTNNFVPSGVPVIRGINLNESKFTDEHFVFITEEKADELSSASAFPGDIVFTHRGTIGQVGIIPFDAEFPRYIVSQSQMKLSCDTKKVDPFFVYYYFISPVGQYELLSNTSTTGVPAIAQPLTSLRRIPILLPSINEQKKISAILQNLDKKIRVIHGLDKILEKIIQSIFKSWFTNFEGQTEFVNSELGPIPKGWKIGKLGNVVDNLRETIEPEEISASVNYVGLEHLPRGSIWLTEWESGSKLQSNKFQFKKGDLLFGKLRPYFKKVVVSPIDGVCSTDILVLKTNATDWLAYVLALISSDDFINYTDRTSTGTRMPRANWETMRDYPIVIPPSNLIKSLSNLVTPIIQNGITLIHESHHLKKIRDAILPKLISGQTRI